MNAVLRYSSHTPTAADCMTRMLAAPRITAERLAREAAAARLHVAALEAASEIRSALRAEGAVTIGFKICWPDFKQRIALALESDECFDLLVRTYGEDAEVWGITASGEYSKSVF